MVWWDTTRRHRVPYFSKSGWCTQPSRSQVTKKNELVGLLSFLSFLYNTNPFFITYILQITKKKIYITNCFLHSFIYKRNMVLIQNFIPSNLKESWREYSRREINNTTAELYISVLYSSKTPFQHGVKWMTRVFCEGILTLALKIEYEELINNTSNLNFFGHRKK